MTACCAAAVVDETAVCSCAALAGEALHPFLSAFKFGLRYQLGFARPFQELGWAGLNPFTAPAAMEAKFQAARQVRRPVVATGWCCCAVG